MATSKEVKARYRERHRDELREKGRRYYHRDPRRHKNNWLKRRYKITIEEYDGMVESQSNCCAICKKPEIATTPHGSIKPLSVDHNHITGKVRALLCFKCNYTLGIVESSGDYLEQFRKYLEEWKEKHGVVVL